jgi:hypothetical protein
MTRERQSQESGCAVSDHDEFRILCAISISGCMTVDEERRLWSHLVDCGECRRFVAEYGSVAASAMPSLVSDFPEEIAETPGWSVEASKRGLFRRLEENRKTDLQVLMPSAMKRGGKRRSTWFFDTRHLLPYAAGLAAMLAVGTLSYRLGVRSVGAPSHLVERAPLENARTDDDARLKDIAALRNQLEARDRTIANLNGRITRQLDEIRDLTGEDQNLQASLQSAEKQSLQSAAERDGVSHKLEQAQAELRTQQSDLDSLHQQRADEALRLADLQEQAQKYPAMLKEKDATIEQQRELIARDKDIVELIGARNMTLQEVYDVGSNAETKKPFGRVFYTKGKSLIFYAYDLDRQPHAHETSTFQVWGKRGPDLSQAMNMGTLYEDSPAHKRWVLKFDDTKFLDQIDMVFVTTEPQGGSRKPTTKGFLFTYLRVEPNHP